MGYITSTDLQSALSPATYLAIYDDSNTGTANATAVAFTLERAHAQVLSYLPAFTSTAPGAIAAAFLPLLRMAETDYAVAYSYERHPEYVRTFGEQPRAERYKRAEQLMVRISTGMQRPQGDTGGPLGASPVVGGVVFEGGPRVMIQGPDGTSNGGDF